MLQAPDRLEKRPDLSAMMGQSYSGSYGFQILHLRERKATKSPRKGVEGRKGGKRGRGLCLFLTQGLLRGTAG